MQVQPAPERRGATGQGLVAAAVVLACLYLASSLVMTLVITVLLVFVCEPGVSWLGRRGIPRGPGAMLMVMLVSAFFYLLFYLFYAQAVTFIEDFPKYSHKLAGHVVRFKQKAELFQQETQKVMGAPGEVARPQSATDVGDVSSYLGAGLRSATELLFMASFVPFLVFFMLTWRDHMWRHSLTLFGMGSRMAAEKTLAGVTLMIRGFILGNLIIGVILSALSALFFWLMGLPYAGIMGPVSGFLSIVPYLGVPLAAIPPVLAGVGKYDTLAPLVAIIAAVAGLHILALNLLYPKLVGARVHLNPVVVTLALMFWGWLWGAMGLLLAVPITAGMKALCDNVPAWRPYGRLMGD